jgi:cytochrome c-type biogenesis protein CcmE
MRLFVVGAIFILSAVTLVTVGILSSGIRRFEVKDLFDPDSEMKPGETIVVDNGQIVAIESLSPNLVFKYATEQQPAEIIRVESSRNPPENFRVGIGASIKGIFDPEARSFKAYQVSTNCPSRYDPKEELKKIDQQQKAGGQAAPYKPAPGGASLPGHRENRILALRNSASLTQSQGSKG